MSEPAKPETGEIVAWLRREAEHALNDGSPEALRSTLIDAADRLVEQANQLEAMRDLIETLGEPTLGDDGDWYVLDSRDDRVYLTGPQLAAWEAE